MRLRSFRSCAGFRFERLRSPAMALFRLLDPDEMADLPQHTGELRALLPLDRAADLAEAERAQRAAVARGLADLTTRLGDLQLRHRFPFARSAAPARS